MVLHRSPASGFALLCLGVVVGSGTAQACPGAYASASCDPSGTAICGSVSGSYLECTLQNAYGGSAMRAYAVTGGTTLCGTGKDICVWGEEIAATTNLFCCNLNGTTETYLRINGTDDGPSGDEIYLQYDTYDLDNYDTSTISVFEGIVQASDGDDLVIGSRIASATYRDKLYGGDDDDSIDGDDGSDEIGGGVGNDDLAGGNGNDIINGDSDGDSIEGNGGSDTIDGGQGQDLISGGAGADAVLGGSDGDTICGDDGDDGTLNGGSGNDTIWGGSGSNDYGDGGIDVDYCDVENPTSCEHTLTTGRPTACPGP